MALGTPVAAAAAYSASGGTSVAPAYPTGITAGDVLILIVGQKPSTANGGTVTTPTGWTLRDELVGAGGYGTTLGADTGNTNLRVYTKNTVAGTETGTLAVTLGVNNIAWAFIIRVPDQGGTLSFGTADGQRTTAPTSPLSIALTNGAAATNFATGDIALWAMCTPTDVAGGSQFSVPTITATGATFSAGTELNEPFNALGNDIGGYSAWAQVTAGSSSTAPTVTTTLSGTLTNVRGPVVLLRIRETLPARTGTFSATESGSDSIDTQGKAPKLGTVSYSIASPTSISVDYPAGITVNDALFLIVATKDPDDVNIGGAFAPSGWASIGSNSGQGGYLSPFAENTGNVGYSIFKKDNVTGSESGSFAVTLGNTNVAWAFIVRYVGSPLTKPVSYAAYSATMLTFDDPATPRTGFINAASSPTDLVVNAGDTFIYFGVSSSTQFGTNTFSGHVLNPASAFTVGPVKQVVEYGTNNGLNIGGFVAWTDVRSGSAYEFGAFNYSLVNPVALGGALGGIFVRPIAWSQGTFASTEGADTFSATRPRPDLGVRTGSFAASETDSDSFGDGAGSSVSGFLLNPPVFGTIAYSATTTIAPAYPAGIAANSIIVMFVAQKPSTANGGTITTPAGWTLQGSQLAAGGYGTTLGIDTGNQNLWVFTKTTVTGTETGTVSVTLGTSNVAWAVIASLQRSNAYATDYLTFKESTGNAAWDTGIQVVLTPIATNPGGRTDIKPSDFFLLAASIATDNATPTNFSNLNFNDAGNPASFITAFRVGEPDSASGNDIGGLLGWSYAKSSSYPDNDAYVAVTADVVNSVNAQGPVVGLRIRVAYPTLTGDLASTESADTFAATGTAGSVTNGTATVTGTTAASSAATITAIAGTSATATVTGTAATSTAATITAKASATATATGTTATSAAATITATGGISATATVTGTSAASTAATIAATGGSSIVLTGLQATSAAATVSALAGATATATGVSSAPQAATIAATGTATATVTGSQAASTAATITATAGGSGTAVVAGQQVSSVAATIAGNGAALIVVAGTTAASAAASINASGGSPTDANVSVPSVEALISPTPVSVTVGPAPSQGGGGGGGYSFSMDRAIDVKKKKPKPAEEPVVAVVNAIAKAGSVSIKSSAKSISAVGVISIGASAKPESAMAKTISGRFSARGIQNLSDEDLILLLAA